MGTVPTMAPVTASVPLPIRSTTKITNVMEVPEHVFPGPSVKLNVPFDAHHEANPSTPAYTPARKLMRRESLDHREALLKGKEGSRQRRRWENDRLLSNPWAIPPLPSDWEVRPTYPTRTVPYYLAPLWDAAEFQRAIESKLKGRTNSRSHAHKSGPAHPGMSPMEEAASKIPKEVRAKLKRARSAKGLLHDLEEEVRAFVRAWNAREARLQSEGLGDVALMSESEVEDEEIVFIGRNGLMHDSESLGRQTKEEGDGTISREKLMFEGMEGDKGAAFARWLVHCVGSYYGLRTWSVTRELEGQEKMRVAYVGVDSRARGFMGKGMEIGKDIDLPRPLWGMV